MLELFQAGGWLMVPILACSVVALTIIMERLWALRRARVLPAALLEALRDAAQGSFKLNDEANINVRDRDFAAEQRRLFEADLQKAERFTLEMHRGRPLHVKLWDGVMSIFRPQL